MEFLFRKSSLLIYPDDSKSIIAYISSYSCFGICIIYSTKKVSGVLHEFFLLYNTVALTTTPIKVIVNINTIMPNIFLYSVSFSRSSVARFISSGTAPSEIMSASHVVKCPVSPCFMDSASSDTFSVIFLVLS